MTRPIDANALIETLEEEYKKLNQACDETSVFQAPNDVALYCALMQEVRAVVGMIENAPTVDAEPVRHGKWNRYYRMHSGDTFVCNRCGSCFVVLQGEDKMNSCPNCRARMDEE